jgi:diguanylate cyclase (GGDEF)-like protein
MAIDRFLDCHLGGQFLSLRIRTLLVVTCTLLSLFVGLYWASSSILLKGFSALEQHEAAQQIDQAQSTVNVLLEALALHAQDWAHWDDTYAYIENGNVDYVRSNLPAETFSELDVDLFLYFSRNGTVFSGFQYSADHSVVRPSDKCVSDIMQNHQFVQTAEGNPPLNGVMLVEGRPMLVTAASVLTSEGEGPCRGTLLVGRYLTEARLLPVARPAGLSLSLVSAQLLPQLSVDSPTMVRVEGEDIVAGYALLSDGHGRRVAILRVDASRWIFNQGKKSQYYLMLNLVAAGALFVVLLLILLHRLILSRLARLGKGVAMIREDGDLSIRLPVEGKDELECLAAIINETLETLQKTQHALRHDALHDPLTGLANRLLFFHKVNEAMENQLKDPQAAFAMLLIDIDHFKLINDSFGHGAGDELLMLAAERLCRFFRSGDTVARLGGDEFAVLLDPLKDEVDALHRAQDFLSSLQEPVSWNGHLLHLSASIGVAVCRRHDPTLEQSPGQLLRDADTAMYHAKREGRNCVALFDESMGEEVKSYLTLQNDLRGAAGRGELRVCYQPIFLLDTGKLYGFEALVRWEHPALGLLSPNRFIPLAESGGFMAEIDTWVFREASQCLRRWQEHFPFESPLHVSVNLSCTHAQLLDVIPELCRILSTTGLDGRHVGLEITESAMVVAKQDFVEQLHDLKACGVRLYLDDFGTGYSSLSRLHRLPIDVLKVDRSFITELETGDGEIVRTIMTLAHGLGMQVVAEGIESQEQLSKLQNYGCDFGQGYLYSKPLTEEHVTRILQRLYDADKNSPADDSDFPWRGLKPLV